MVVKAILLGLAVTGFALAGWFYWHLYRWAKECQGARITIAYKRKVKIDAPLVEWMLWIRQANKDKSTGGRIVYSVGGTQVAILKRVKVRKRRLRTLITLITSRIQKEKTGGQSKVVHGVREQEAPKGVHGG